MYVYFLRLPNYFVNIITRVCLFIKNLLVKMRSSAHCMLQQVCTSRLVVPKLAVISTSSTAFQRWSRGHKARGQGKDTKKQPRPRPRNVLPRTDPLEAKDRNAQGQGPRTQAQVLSKKKFFFQAISKKKPFKKFLLVLELRSRGFYV